MRIGRHKVAQVKPVISAIKLTHDWNVATAVYDTLSHLAYKFSLFKLSPSQPRNIVLFLVEIRKKRWCINLHVMKRKSNLWYRLVKLHSKRAGDSLRDQHLNQSYTTILNFIFDPKFRRLSSNGKVKSDRSDQLTFVRKLKKSKENIIQTITFE